MTDEERKGYRELFNLTKIQVENGEAYEARLRERPASEVRDQLLVSTEKRMESLRGDAEKLQKLGWENGNA